MGRTITEKIVSRAAGREVQAGEFVTVRPDRLIMSEYYWPHIQEVMQQVGIEAPWDRQRIVIVPDHTNVLAIHPPETPVQRSLVQYTKQYGIDAFFPIGRGGIRHQVSVEHGYVTPGILAITDEPNIASIGALGALNYPIGWDIAVIFLLGETWMRVPETIQVVVNGEPGPGVTSRDLAQQIIGDVGEDGGLWQTIEYTGPGIAAMSVDARMNLLALAYLAGGESAIVNPDDKTLDYLSRLPLKFDYAVLRSDPDAVYTTTLEYDLSQVGPKVNGPNSPAAAADVGAVAGRPIDQACIGSCSSGRIGDLRAAAAVLKGRKIHRDVRFYITPISLNVQRQALREGLMDVFADAGAVVLPPGCNTCFGYLGVLDAGETCIATHSVSYAGRMGSREAQIYLANPYVVAASAVEGAIADPRALLTAAELAAVGG